MKKEDVISNSAEYTELYTQYQCVKVSQKL